MSFLGFVPSRTPALTVIVMVDTPRVGSDTGGVVAAPIFKRIAEAACGISASRRRSIPPPPVMVASAERAASDAGVSLPRRGPEIVAARLQVGGDSVAVPDLRGLSARDALRTLAKLGLSAASAGHGCRGRADAAPAGRRSNAA